MNTIGQSETAGRVSANSRSGRSGARAGIVLLLAILVQMGTAKMAIGFPLALESVATRANVDAAVSTSPQTPDIPAQSAEEIEEAVVPFIADDIRTEGLMQASAGTAGSVDRSTPEGSGNNC